MLGVALAALLAACSSMPLAPRQPRSTAATPVLSTEYVLGAVHADGDLEFEDLASVPGNAAKLRRAWIQLSMGHPQAGIDTAAEVLYGVQRPAPSEEALARYIRSECYRRMGEPGRGKYDRDQALRLALDPELQRLLQPRDVAVAAAAPKPDARNLSIEPRSAWHPLPMIGQRLDPMERIYRITVHHSAMLFRDSSAASCANEIRVIQHSHMASPDRRYGDIGYHYLIDPAGRIWEGRNLRYQGAHARADNNRGNIGICLLGNFVHGGGGQRPTPAQSASLRQLLASLSSRYHVVPDEIHGHRDFVTTECPGPYVESLLTDIIRDFKRDAAGAAHLAAHD